MKKRKIKTGNKIIDKLYEAVRDYIEEREGKVVMIGGVAVMSDSVGPKFNYSLLVRITGKRPVFKPDSPNLLEKPK